MALMRMDDIIEGRTDTMADELRMALLKLGADSLQEACGPAARADEQSEYR